MDIDARKKLEKASQDLLDNQEGIEAQQTVLAQLLKSKFDALVKTGFNDAQALEIIKARGLEA